MVTQVFICISLMARDVEQFFLVLICHLHVFFDVTFMSLCPLSGWIVCLIFPVEH